MDLTITALLCLLKLGHTSHAQERDMGTEQRLYNDLFSDYNHESRPVANASKKVMVDFGISLNQLLGLDEKKQVLTTALWIYEEWTDENLVWSEDDYDGLHTLMIPSHIIWLPDIFLFNKAGENVDGFVNVNGSKVLIENDGRVRWMVPLMMKSSCAVDVTYFPYDQQKCHLKFGSWIYDITQLDMRVTSAGPDMTHYVQNSEYDLVNVSMSRSLVNGSCCPGNGYHAMIGFHMHVKRKSLYYDYIVIAPTIMLCLLTLVTFLLPCHKGEKISIGLTVFLTLYVLQLLIAENVPDTNSTPILGVFLFMVMTFNCVSLIMATVVMNIKKRGDEKQCPDVPRWLLWVSHSVLSKIVMTKYAWEESTSLCVEESCDINSAPSSMQNSPSDTGIGMTNEIYEGVDNLQDDSTCTTELLQNSDRRVSADNSLPVPTNRRRFISLEGQIDVLNPVMTGQMRGSTPSTDIRYSVTSMCYHSMQMKRQWFFIAEVVDKFSFLIYLISMTFSVTMILIVIPHYYQTEVK